MSEPVYKKVEIVGTSSDSFEKATENAVAKAGASLHGMSWFEVVEPRGAIADGQVRQYQATIRIGFKID